MSEATPATGNPAPLSRSSWLATRWRALRAFSFPVSVLPVPVAVAAAVPVGQWRWDVLVLSAIGAGLLHAAGNLLNDYYDYLAGVDRKVEGDDGRPGRLLVRGEMTPVQVRREALACLALLGPVGAYLIWRCGPGLLGFAAAGAIGLYAYTGPPLKLKYRALGEGLIFLVFGPLLMLGAAYAQTARWEWVVALLSVPVGLATTAILVGNNLRDEDEDGSSGITTLTHVIGPRRMRAVYLVCVLGSAAMIAALAAVGVLPRILLAAPLLLVLLAKPLRCLLTGQRLPDIDARTARYEAVLLAAVLAALVIR